MAVLVPKSIRYIVGVILTFDFLLFWALPIFLQGVLWKAFVKRFARPIYDRVDTSTSIRAFTTRFLYNHGKFADFFATQVFAASSMVVCIGALLFYQRSIGDLPLPLVIAYYFMWVGPGGRTMGAAYTFAHKEGHNKNMYQPWIRNTIGNFFENVLGVFYGNVPYNFTTSHAYVHHRLDGGMGDTFYLWDLDRTSVHSLMLYVYRIFLHMTGFSSWVHFSVNKSHIPLFVRQEELLLRGCIQYWLLWPTVLLLATNFSFRFLFYMYVQPLICMTYFLAFLNFGFHGFLERAEDGSPVMCVNNTCIIDGEDDSFGEDDHMSHHYSPTMHHAELPAQQAKLKAEWTEKHASVFTTFSIVELSVLLLSHQWDRLSDFYVDFSGKMTKKEIGDMLRIRAMRTEISHESYERWVITPDLRTTPQQNNQWLQKSRS